MKHLKGYNESIKANESLNIKDVNFYIQDLFSDVIDSGVRVFLHKAGLPSRYTIKIGEYSDQVKFKYSDISDEIEHLKSHLINDGNMRLSDVEVDLVKDTQRYEIFGYGRRLQGWERLNILKEKDIELYSMSIGFIVRGTNI